MHTHESAQEKWRQGDAHECSDTHGGALAKKAACKRRQQIAHRRAAMLPMCCCCCLLRLLLLLLAAAAAAAAAAAKAAAAAAKAAAAMSIKALVLLSLVSSCVCATEQAWFCDTESIDGHKNGTEAPFYHVCFSIGCDRPLTFFKKILRIFTTEASFLSLGRDIPLTFFKKILRIFTTEASFLSLGCHTITAV